MFYCLLDLSCGECYVIFLYFVHALLVYLFVLCVARLTEFHQTIRNVFGCGCYFVAEWYGSV